MKRIQTKKRRVATILLIPSIFYNSYHNGGKKIVNIGVCFMHWCRGFSIELGNKNEQEYDKGIEKSN